MAEPISLRDSGGLPSLLQTLQREFVFEDMELPAKVQQHDQSVVRTVLHHDPSRRFAKVSLTNRTSWNRTSQPSPVGDWAVNPICT